jgi:hypothetical protein
LETGNGGKLKVRSLYTIGSPHRGSILADVASLCGDSSPDSDIDYLIKSTSWAKSIIYMLIPAIKDLRVSEMKNFNRDFPLLSSYKFYNFAGDADINNDSKISDREAYPAVDVPFYSSIIATSQYKVLRSAKTLRAKVGSSLLFPGIVISVDQASVVGQPNDLLVTYDSAIYDEKAVILPMQKANHTTMKSSIVGASIINQIFKDFPIAEN